MEEESKQPVSASTITAISPDMESAMAGSAIYNTGLDDSYY